ncbi:hypothetical protein CEXT_635681 [Caerostris extrusa]|uniref:Uncharacterized protein n=1 Tax=Caerostris extrusa TaxID=172846 RepID=A0AAV4RQP5_CAEEX|nr:hypothetical protein CEXT_635681 [Caerostris extrusa]
MKISPSKALLVISKRASSGEVFTDPPAGLSEESLSNLSDRESSSADRGLRLDVAAADPGPPKSQGLTIPRSVEIECLRGVLGL